MKEKYLIDCCYMDKLITDEIIAEVKFNGKIYRGCLSKLVIK